MARRRPRGSNNGVQRRRVLEDGAMLEVWCGRAEGSQEGEQKEVHGPPPRECTYRERTPGTGRKRTLPCMRAHPLAALVCGTGRRVVGDAPAGRTAVNTSRPPKAALATLGAAVALITAVAAAYLPARWVARIDPARWRRTRARVRSVQGSPSRPRSRSDPFEFALALALGSVRARPRARGQIRSTRARARPQSRSALVLARGRQALR